MKRMIILIGTIILVIFLIFSYKYLQFQNGQVDIKKYNQPYLQFDKENLYGTDITSVINKAINSNEKNKIKKNESDEYISNEDSSIKVYITFEDGGTTYPMERLNKSGIKEFTEYFGEVRFKCTSVKYHENGKISEMYFQAINY